MHPGGTAGLLVQAGHLQPVGAHRTEALGLGQDGEHEAAVVGLAVVEQVAAGGLPGGQRGQQLDDLVAGDRAVAVGAPLRPVGTPAPTQALAGHDVVEVEAHAGQAVGTRPVEGGHDEGQRGDQVRREGDHELALQQRLADQPQVEVLQVAQAAVNQLGGAAGGARGEVGTLGQRHAVAAAGGVEGHAGPRDPTADHHDVERLAVHGGQGVRAGDHAVSLGLPGPPWRPAASRLQRLAIRVIVSSSRVLLAGASKLLAGASSTSDRRVGYDGRPC